MSVLKYRDLKIGRNATSMNSFDRSVEKNRQYYNLRLKTLTEKRTMFGWKTAKQNKTANLNLL